MDSRYRALGLSGDPCLCGETETWHPACYAGLSQSEIDTKMANVWKKLRQQAAKRRKQMVQDIIAKAKRPPS